MNEKNADKPACPTSIYDDYTGKPSGLSKREFAAIMAMQGLLAEQIDSEGALKSLHMNPESLCFAAVKYADALLSELEKPQNSPKQPTT